MYRVVQEDCGNVRYSSTVDERPTSIRVRLSVKGTEKDSREIMYVPLITRDKCTSQGPVAPGGPLVGSSTAAHFITAHCSYERPWCTGNQRSFVSPTNEISNVLYYF